MFDMLSVAVYLMPNRKMSWDELAAACEPPSWPGRVAGALASLVSLGARFRRAKGRQALRDRSDSAAGCRAPA